MARPSNTTSFPKHTMSFWKKILSVKESQRDDAALRNLLTKLSVKSRNADRVSAATTFAAMDEVVVFPLMEMLASHSDPHTTAVALGILGYGQAFEMLSHAVSQ